MKLEVTSLTLGAIVGAASSFLLTYTLVKRAADERAFQAIQEVKQHYAKRMAKEAAVAKPPIEEVLAKMEKQIQADEPEPVKEEPVENIQRVNLLSGSFKPPYTITPHEVENTNNQFVSWTFYAEDAVLADEDDDIVKDINEFVGDCLTELIDDGDVIYVRNDRLKLDIEIMATDEAYASTPKATMNKEEYEAYVDMVEDKYHGTDFPPKSKSERSVEDV